jgi:hypothetical protein
MKSLPQSRKPSPLTLCRVKRARQRRRPFREILEETIQRGLSAPPSSSVKQVRIQTHRVGIKPAYQGLSMNQLYDQIEAEDYGKR